MFISSVYNFIFVPYYFFFFGLLKTAYLFWNHFLNILMTPYSPFYKETNPRDPFSVLFSVTLICWMNSCSVQFSRSVVSDFLWPRESQHARPPCPSPTPGVHPNSCASSWWCHPAISSSVVLFSSCPQSLPASGSFPMSGKLFGWGCQSIGVSASASVLPMNNQDCSPLGWTGWISLQSKGLSRVFSNTTVQKHQFFGTQLFSQSNSHIIHDHWKNHSLD